MLRFETAAARAAARRVGCLAALCSFLAGAALAQPKVIGYYPSWVRGSLPASNVRFQYLTHINQAFAWPLADGSITSYPDLLYPGLVTAAHQAGRKVLVSLGGAGQEQTAGFAPMTADSVIRARFVSNLVSYLETNGFDGADIDWETPKNGTERGNLLKLVRDLREAFNVEHPDWLLTMAIPPSTWSAGNFDYAGMLPYLDWYNVMNYDTHGSWSTHAGHNCPLYAPAFDTDGSIDQSMRYLTGTRHIPNSKLVPGIPFYAKEFTADSLYRPSSACTDILYSVIPARIAAGWNRHWDTTSHVPYLTRAQNHRTVCYEDSLSVTQKSRYALDGGYGGVMIWALGQDIVGGRQVLLEAIGKAMEGAADVPDDGGPGLPLAFRLEQNFPNPFNPSTVIRFDLATGGDVSLAVYDVLGREVAMLVRGRREAGQHQATWDAREAAGGVYFYSLRSGSSVETRRMLLLK
jgi:chitinase